MAVVHPNLIQIIVGGQYGSEAKGLIAAHLASNIDIAVRTGATNAGHTAYYRGTRVVCQQLPCAWVNPDAKLVLGAGSLIDIDILNRECETITRLTGVDTKKRLVIDRRAYIHRHEHHERSSMSGRHKLIGATGKGCSEALIDRIRLRGVQDWSIGHIMGKDGDNLGIRIALDGYQLDDAEAILNEAWDEGARIQLEGTQGQLLDLYLGPYPYTTHKQTGPAQWMLECGLSPALPTDIVMVARTFPIRVAGNSGPLLGETSWPDLARRINVMRAGAGLPPIVEEMAVAAFEDAVRRAAADYAIPDGSDGLDQHQWSDSDRVRFRTALSDLNQAALNSLPSDVVDELRKLFEITTVTRKLRRVAQLSIMDLAQAARQIRPHRIALTFMNYVFPEDWYRAPAELSSAQERYCAQIERVCRSRVDIVSFGPESAQIVENLVTR